MPNQNAADDWQWCHVCYGFTIHKDDTCTQCGNALRTFEVACKNYVFITVADRQTLQIKAEYEISLN